MARYLFFVGLIVAGMSNAFASNEYSPSLLHGVEELGTSRFNNLADPLEKDGIYFNSSDVSEKLTALNVLVQISIDEKNYIVESAHYYTGYKVGGTALDGLKDIQIIPKLYFNEEKLRLYYKAGALGGRSIFTVFEAQLKPIVKYRFKQGNF